MGGLLSTQNGKDPRAVFLNCKVTRWHARMWGVSKPKAYLLIVCVPTGSPLSSGLGNLSPRSSVWRFDRNDFCLVRALFNVLLSLLILSAPKSQTGWKLGDLEIDICLRKNSVLKTFYSMSLRDYNSKYKNIWDKVGKHLVPPDINFQ